MTMRAMSKHLNDVRPFVGLVYDAQHVHDVGACLSQPYDVISPVQQDAYYPMYSDA